MGIKYIIEMEDKPFELLSEDGLTSEKLFRVKGFNSLVFDWNGLNMLTPYTEPDMEQVRKKAYDKAYADAVCNCSEGCSHVKQVRKEAYDKCMNEAEDLAYKLYSPKIDEAYQRGLNDAWEAARKIADIPYGEEKKVFGSDGWTFIANHTAQEAIEEIRQYEQKKEEIQVGDEVVSTCGKAVVHEVNEGNVYYIYADGERGYNPINQVRKTGRHFPEIVEVLQKMREET